MRASGESRADRRDRLDAVHPRQLQVHQRDVGAAALELLDRLFRRWWLRPPPSMSDCSPTMRRDTFAHQAVIVHAQHSYHVVPRHSTASGAVVSIVVPYPGAGDRHTGPDSLAALPHAQQAQRARRPARRRGGPPERIRSRRPSPATIPRWPGTRARPRSGRPGRAGRRWPRLPGRCAAAASRPRLCSARAALLSTKWVWTCFVEVVKSASSRSRSQRPPCPRGRCCAARRSTRGPRGTAWPVCRRSRRRGLTRARLRGVELTGDRLELDADGRQALEQRVVDLAAQARAFGEHAACMFLHRTQPEPPARRDEQRRTPNTAHEQELTGQVEGRRHRELPDARLAPAAVDRGTDAEAVHRPDGRSEKVAVRWLPVTTQSSCRPSSRWAEAQLRRRREIEARIREGQRPGPRRQVGRRRGVSIDVHLLDARRHDGLARGLAGRVDHREPKTGGHPDPAAGTLTAMARPR